MPNHKLDTNTHVFFYEQEFYVLSNFSAFTVHWQDHHFPTAEHAYQWAKFDYVGLPKALTLANLKTQIRTAASAHEALTLARRNHTLGNPEWPSLRVQTMRNILSTKVQQHEYVKRKLMETGKRVLVEDSWRDSWWGWGEDQQGNNMLGQLWMEIRTELQNTRAGGSRHE